MKHVKINDHNKRKKNVKLTNLIKIIVRKLKLIIIIKTKKHV
jgi:hypothetical protein